MKRVVHWSFFLLVTLANSISAQTETDFWPELQFYHRLNEQFRMRLAAGFTRSQPLQGKTEGFAEVDLDVGLKRILRRKLHPDEEKDKYISTRVGYAYLENFSEDDPPPEHRLLMEATGRLPLPSNFLLSDRHRGELRWIGDDDSKRYRNRIRLERDSIIRNFRLNPYVQTEFYYDTKVDGWNRNEYTLGSEFPIRNRFVLEFYYMYQNNRGEGSTDVNGVGTVFQLYW